MRAALRQACKSGLSLFLALTLVITITPPPLNAQSPGGTIKNGSTSAPPGIVVPGFLFEPEVPLMSLKEVPTWNELEQLLDNPYNVALCSSLPASVDPLVRNTPGLRRSRDRRRHWPFPRTAPPVQSYAGRVSASNCPPFRCIRSTTTRPRARRCGC
jgi:hypothetical protein